MLPRGESGPQHRHRQAGAGQRADAEGAMHGRETRFAAPGLDHRALGVHCDIHRTGDGANGKQAGRQQCR